MSARPRRFWGLLAALFSLFPLKGCKPASPPAVAGVSIELRYPVMLIGQRTFDVRHSESSLSNVPGGSSLNLNGRLVLESDGRLFEIVNATPEKESKPFFPDMGTGSRFFEVALREKKKPAFSAIQDLALAEINAPNSIWPDDPEAAKKANARIHSLRTVEELIAACSEYWNWTR